MNRRIWDVVLVSAVLLVVLLALVACGGKPQIVRRWEMTATEGSWPWGWMEFFADGTQTDDWGNSHTWSMPSANRLKIVAGFGAGTYSYDIKITGDRMEIVDEYGNKAVGVRQ